MNMRLSACAATLAAALGVPSPAAADLAPPAPAASQPTTAPTGPIARAVDAGRTTDEGIAALVPSAVPQLGIVLKRGESPSMTALKPGRKERARGGVDDGPARCAAERDAPTRSRC